MKKPNLPFVNIEKTFIRAKTGEKFNPFLNVHMENVIESKYVVQQVLKNNMIYGFKKTSCCAIHNSNSLCSILIKFLLSKSLVNMHF